MKTVQLASSPQQWQTHLCNTAQRCILARPQRMHHTRTPASQFVAHHDGRASLAVRCSRAHRRGAARPALHPASAQLGHGHSNASRDLLDCWPGCSRASWIEGGPELGGSGIGFASGSGGVALSAAALAEPPAEPAAEPPDADESRNSVTRVSLHRRCRCAWYLCLPVAAHVTSCCRRVQASMLEAGMPNQPESSCFATQILAPEEFEQQLASHGSDLVVLMCKAHSCRPCKVNPQHCVVECRTYQCECSQADCAIL